MHHPQIIGLGIANVDVVLRLEQMPTWENPGKVSGFALANGGPAGTACAVAATFGVPTGFVDTIGDDEMAIRKRKELERVGVEISHMVNREGPEDHVVIVYVNEKSGERYFSGVSKFTSRPIKPEELNRDYLSTAQYLHLDGNHAEAALQAARWMHEAGKKVVLDGNKTNRPIPELMRELVTETDILVCSSDFGIKLTGHKDLGKVGRSILDRGPEIVVLTDGKEGSYTINANEEFHTPAFDVNVIDTTGAGDVFHGAYLVGLVQNWDSRRTAAFASAVSAIHCTVLGNRNGIPTMEEVETFLSERI